MRGRRAACVPALLSLVLAAGCSAEPDRPTLTIEARVEVCSSAAACRALPATGARVVVRSPGGDVYTRRVLGQRGGVSMLIEPGIEYDIEVSMPDLGLRSHVRSDALAGTEENETTLDLPTLHVSPMPH